MGTADRPGSDVIADALLLRIDEALAALRNELFKAMKKHAPMHSPHEGHSVIAEELDELWDLVKQDLARTTDGRKEALQVAAMGLRFALDLCDGDLPTSIELQRQRYVPSKP